EDAIVFPAKPPREATRYAIDVSEVVGLRLVSNVLEFLDAQGAPRLRVRAPFVIDAKGTKRAATLSLHGCMVDTDPRGPWERPLTAPGATSCDVEVSWEGLGVLYPATVDPAWTLTASLVEYRWYPQAAVLPSKRVLIVGGNFSGSTTEIYDPKTGTCAV